MQDDGQFAGSTPLFHWCPKRTKIKAMLLQRTIQIGSATIGSFWPGAGVRCVATFLPVWAKLGNRPTDIEIAAGCDPPAFCVRCIIIGVYVRYRANRSHSCLGNLCGYCWRAKRPYSAHWLPLSRCRRCLSYTHCCHFAILVSSCSRPKGSMDF